LYEDLVVNRGVKGKKTKQIGSGARTSVSTASPEGTPREVENGIHGLWIKRRRTLQEEARLGVGVTTHFQTKNSTLQGGFHATDGGVVGGDVWGT